jgi:hypothetical protein
MGDGLWGFTLGGLYRHTGPRATDRGCGRDFGVSIDFFSNSCVLFFFFWKMT